MRTTIWLRVQGKKSCGRWAAGPVAVSKSKPGYKRNEVALQLEIEIPDRVFEDPVFVAKVTLPSPQSDLPLSAEVAEQVGAALSAQMGFQVRVSVDSPAEGVEGAVPA